MTDKIINSFDVWITAQGLKSKGRLRSIDNISLEGIKKLRELILELAVTGSLTSRDSNDEPASVLLEKILADKERLRKRDRSAQIIEEKDKPFEVPKTWSFVRLSDIAYQITDGAHHTPRYVAHGIPFMSVKDMSSGYLDFSDTRFISEDQHAVLIKRCNPEKGDLLLTKVGTTGIPILIDTEKPFSIFVSVALIKFPKHLIDGKYLSLLIKSPLVKRQSEEGTEGIGNKNLVLRKINSFILVLPPQGEQHRIVAKVDELMALCDEMEKQERHHLKSHQLLVETLLDTLTRANDEVEFQAGWSRLAQHFDNIFTTEDSIVQLKQTILQLAVMGKLVPQDPNDEPAIELLKRIEKEKERLVKEEKIKKQKASAGINANEVRSQLPSGWSWCRLNDVVRFSGGGTPSMSRSEYWGGEIPWISPKDMGEEYVSNSEMKITKEGVENSTAKMIPQGSLLIVARSGILKRRLPVAINTVDCTVNQDIKVLIPYAPETNTYLLLMFTGLERLILESYVKIGTTVHSLKYESFEVMPVPLPPLQEQKRIMSKVKELFALCDRLKERIVESQKMANLMADSIIEQVA